MITLADKPESPQVVPVPAIGPALVDLTENVLDPASVGGVIINNGTTYSYALL